MKQSVNLVHRMYSLILIVLVLVRTSAYVDAQPLSLKKSQHHPKSQTSRGLRETKTLQITSHLMFFGLNVQMGLDLDYLLNKQTSVGISIHTFLEIFGINENTHQSVHIKHFLGNSFYIKPSVGLHKVVMKDPASN